MSDRTCSINGCGRSHSANGYCKAHDQRVRLTGDPRPGDPPIPRVARVAHRNAARRYSLNESYFDAVDTPEKAYWLGFIAADGSVLRRGTKSYLLRIELATRDEPHLKAFAACIGTDSPVKRAVREHGGSLGGSGQFSRIVINSWRMVAALERAGISERKSATVAPWDGPFELMRHYWRGLFDGDGSLGPITTRTHWSLGICGSPQCVLGFAAWAKELCGASAAPRVSQRSALCWQWSCSGTDKPQAIVREMYRDATVALPRKLALAGQLDLIDFDTKKVAGNLSRSLSMQAAWRNGKQTRGRLP